MNLLGQYEHFILTSLKYSITCSIIVTVKIRNQPKTTQTSQKPPKPAKNHPNQPKTTQTNQKPPKPAKNHPKIIENQPKTRQTTQKVSQQTVKI